jgi:hypothetical protein
MNDKGETRTTEGDAKHALYCIMLLSRFLNFTFSIFRVLSFAPSHNSLVWTSFFRTVAVAVAVAMIGPAVALITHVGVVAVVLMFGMLLFAVVTGTGNSPNTVTKRGSKSSPKETSVHRTKII